MWIALRPSGRPQQRTRHWRSCCWCWLWLSCLLCWPGAHAAPEQVRYAGKPRTDYYVELLQLALSYPLGRRYQLTASGLDLPKQRAFELMARRQGIDVLYGTASTERLSRYRAVPFALLRGLNGYRIALVRQQQADLLKNVNSLAQLRKLRAGQFLTWSDTAILQANQLPVVTSTDLTGLFGMLHLQRADYLPLSVLEAEAELARHAEAELVLDEHLLLYYPSATYFFVAPGNQRLAEALLMGLKQAEADGKLAQLFARYFADRLDRLKLQQRRVIYLENPLLPLDVPTHPPQQQPWLQISKPD